MLEYNKAVSELSERNQCEDLTRILKPYVQAAEWQLETGHTIAEVAGINTAADMLWAVQRLSQFAITCAGCREKNFGSCAFSGVEILKPDEVLALVEEPTQADLIAARAVEQNFDW